MTCILYNISNSHDWVLENNMKYYKSYYQSYSVYIHEVSHMYLKCMTSEVLKLVARKNKLYREWKSTSADNENQIIIIIIIIFI